MRSVVRLLVAITLAVCGLCIEPETTASAPHEDIAAYTYDGHSTAAVLAGATLKRGPPVTHDRNNAFDAVDRRSRGAPARSGEAAPAATTTYDTHPSLALVARTTPTTGEGARAVDLSRLTFDHAGVAANTARGDGSAYAHSVVAGGRSDGATVFAGHGEFRVGSGSVTVPEGTTVNVYSPHGAGLSQADGLAIELGGGPNPVAVYGPGSVMPNYTLKAPTGLTVARGSTTVEDATSLSSLLRPGMGVCHWAACTLVR